MSHSTLPSTHETQGITSFWVLIARLMWTLFLPFLFVLTAYRIVTYGQGWFTPWDIAFGVIVVLLLGARWLEQRSGQATTVTGKLSTKEHFHRYVWGLVLIAAGLWVCMNYLGNYILFDSMARISSNGSQ